MRRAATLVVFLLLGIATLGVVFVLGMRNQYPPVTNTVRRINRRVFNPRQLETAGEVGSWASVVHHVGRRSGAAYRTPVGALPTEDGFVIVLPYGVSADWVKNVLAQGAAEISYQGERFAVDQPRVVPTETCNAYFSTADRAAHSLFRVNQCLRLSRVAEAVDIASPST